MKVNTFLSLTGSILLLSAVLWILRLLCLILLFVYIISPLYLCKGSFDVCGIKTQNRFSQLFLEIGRKCSYKLQMCPNRSLEYFYCFAHPATKLMCSCYWWNCTCSNICYSAEVSFLCAVGTKTYSAFDLNEMGRPQRGTKAACWCQSHAAFKSLMSS